MLINSLTFLSLSFSHALYICIYLSNTSQVDVTKQKWKQWHVIMFNTIIDTISSWSNRLPVPFSVLSLRAIHQAETYNRVKSQSGPQLNCQLSHQILRATKLAAIKQSITVVSKNAIISFFTFTLVKVRIKQTYTSKMIVCWDNIYQLLKAS